MKPNRIAVKLRLSKERHDKLISLGKALGVGEKAAAEQCIDTAWDMYVHALQQAIAKKTQDEEAANEKTTDPARDTQSDS